MKTIPLEALKIEKGNAKAIRNDKRIPAVIYGNGIKNELVSVEYQSFRKVYNQAGESIIIEIIIGEQKIPVLVQEIQIDPIRDVFTHIDFHAVKMDQEIYTHIPVKLEGDAPAIKLYGGILVHNKESVEVKCLPNDLVSEIKVDISGLVELKAAITVADLKIPEKITILENPETMIVSIAAPRMEEERKEEAVAPEEKQEQERGEK